MKAILVGQRKDLDKQDKLTFDSEPKEDSQNPVTSGGVYKKTSWMCNPNLLDNWYFANPVNQRGQTTYNSGYTIDRWQIGNWSTTEYTLSITDAGITSEYANGSIWQKIENLSAFVGKTVTFSVLTMDTLYTVTGIIPNQSEEFVIADSVPSHIDIFANSAEITKDYFEVRMRSRGEPITFVAAKLEIGPIQTLAHKENDKWVLNEIPNYTEQLLKCYRYQIQLVGGDKNWGVVGTVSHADGNKFFAHCPLPAALRSTPTVSMSGTWRLTHGKHETPWADGVVVTSLVFERFSANTITLNGTVNGTLDATETYVLCYASRTTENNLILDANL